MKPLRILAIMAVISTGCATSSTDTSQRTGASSTGGSSTTATTTSDGGGGVGGSADGGAGGAAGQGGSADGGSSTGGQGGEGGGIGGQPDPPDPCAVAPFPTCMHLNGLGCGSGSGFTCDAPPGLGCVQTGSGPNNYCCPKECAPSYATNNLCGCGDRSWVCDGPNWPAPPGCYAQGQVANLTCCVAGAPFWP